MHNSPTAIYLHIPFCEVKCGYCDFYSVPRGWEEFDLQETYVTTLCREIDIRVGAGSPRPGEATSPLQSIFFGGGTPSLLRADLLETILKKLSEHFTWDADTEITMETNPKTIDRAGLADRKALGINRISLGVQSFQDPFLKRLGRIHSGKEARRTLEAAQSLGFDKISLDLMFALPGQTFADWQQDVEASLAFGMDHLSCYNLTIEPNTPFSKTYGNGSVGAGSPRPGAATAPLPSDDVSLKQFLWTRERLGAAGLDGYEISNFARPGHESVHNLNYWRYGDYLGFGVSASSFEQLVNRTAPGPVASQLPGCVWNTDGPDSARTTRCLFARRQTNVRDLKRYLNGSDAPAIDPIDRRTAMGEFVMLALRTKDGVSEARFGEIFGEEFTDVFGDALEHVGAGSPRPQSMPRRGAVTAPLLVEKDHHWHLTNEGLRMADSVILEFIS